MKPTVLALFATLLLGAPSCSVELTEPGSPVRATVHFLNIEGGCWVLRTATGKQYEPRGLPAAFRQDGLRVTVTFRPVPDAGSFCMVGEIVEITSIRAR